MRKFIMTHTRPNTSVPFCNPPAALMADFEPYFASGALVSKEVIQTALTKTWINTWRSPEDAAAFTNHQLSAPRHDHINRYNERHGITKTMQIQDVE